MLCWFSEVTVSGLFSDKEGTGREHSTLVAHGVNFQFLSFPRAPQIQDSLAYPLTFDCGWWLALWPWALAHTLLLGERGGPGPPCGD